MASANKENDMEASERELQRGSTVVGARRGDPSRWSRSRSGRNIGLTLGLVVATALAGTVARGKGSTPLGGDGGARQFTASPAKPVSFRGTLDKTAVLVGAAPSVRMELVLGGEAGE